MRVKRSYLVRVVQVYEGDPPTAGWSEDSLFGDDPPTEVGDELYGDDDQYVCDNWKLVSDETELLDYDDLVTRIV